MADGEAVGRASRRVTNPSRPAADGGTAARCRASSPPATAPRRRRRAHPHGVAQAPRAANAELRERRKSAEVLARRAFRFTRNFSPAAGFKKTIELPGYLTQAPCTSRLLERPLAWRSSIRLSAASRAGPSSPRSRCSSRQRTRPPEPARPRPAGAGRASGGRRRLVSRRRRPPTARQTRLHGPRRLIPLGTFSIRSELPDPESKPPSARHAEADSPAHGAFTVVATSADLHQW